MFKNVPHFGQESRYCRVTDWKSDTKSNKQDFKRNKNM